MASAASRSVSEALAMFRLFGKGSVLVAKAAVGEKKAAVAITTNSHDWPQNIPRLVKKTRRYRLKETFK